MKRFTSSLTSSLAMLAILSASLPAMADPQSEASAVSALSAMPLASVVAGGSAVAGSVVALPLALSTAGAILTVKAIESSANGFIYVLERASDGARVSVQVGSAGLASGALVLGTTVAVSVIGAGAILSAAGQVICFVPNAMGRALLHNERLTY